MCWCVGAAKRAVQPLHAEVHTSKQPATATRTPIRRQASGHHTGAELRLPGLEPLPPSGKHFCLAEEVGIGGALAYASTRMHNELSAMPGSFAAACNVLCTGKPHAACTHALCCCSACTCRLHKLHSAPGNGVVLLGRTARVCAASGVASVTVQSLLCASLRLNPGLSIPPSDPEGQGGLSRQGLKHRGGCSLRDLGLDLTCEPRPPIMTASAAATA